MGRSFYQPSAQDTVEDYKVNNSLYNRASDRSYKMIERDRQLEACFQCHPETTSRMASRLPRYDRAPFTYQPGKRLSDYFCLFRSCAGDWT